jgi:alkyl hydroperoxide reductase subunit F
LQPAAQAGGLVGVELESGATLRARTVLAPGARWRQTERAPGEDSTATRA